MGIKHHYLANDRLKTIVSEYGHLQSLHVRPGQRVDRGDTIGTVGKPSRAAGASPLHFQIQTAGDAGIPAGPHPAADGHPPSTTIRYVDDPLAFVRTHRRLLVPGLEDQFVLVVKHQYKMYFYRFGFLKNTYEIALSVTPRGRKERTRDFRVPEGLYRICQKLEGPFANGAAADSSYIGPRWLRLDYPNRHDALRGLQRQFITRDEYHAILGRLQKKTETRPRTLSWAAASGFTAGRPPTGRTPAAGT